LALEHPKIRVVVRSGEAAPGQQSAFRTWGKRIGLVVAVLAAIVALRLTVFRPDPIGVSVHVIAPGRVESTILNSKAGAVRARRRALLSPEIGGRVAFLGVKAGSHVKKGDVLLRLEDRDLKASVSLADRDLEAARAQERQACLFADLAERDLKRNQELSRDKIVSEEMLDQLESRRDREIAACEAARAGAHRADASVDLARAQLAKTVLIAPFSGVVAENKTEVGEWVTPSPAVMAVPGVLDLIDPSSIYVSAPIDEVDSAQVKEGLPARITLDPYPGKALSARVTRVAPYVLEAQEQSRTVEVECDFDDPTVAVSLLPGTSADVEIILEAREPVLRLPAHALMEGDRVLVLTDGKLSERDVEIGLRNWEFAEVKSGVAAGEKVVVSLDRSEVKAGARAREQDGAER
jgi:HlyD family secretion protein